MSSPILQHRRSIRALHGQATDEFQRFRPSVADAQHGTATRPVTGHYRCDSAGGSWWWSPEMFLLHGVDAGSAEPCTELLLASLHPADRPRLLLALNGARGGRSFALESRVVRPDGAQLCVVVVGEPRFDETGAATGVDGTSVDLTGARPQDDTDRIQALETEVGQLRTAMASRAAIEQAKGILMLLTNCGDQVAFDLLAHISSHTHRKVREVAVAITESASGHGGLPDDIRSILRDACPPPHKH